MSSCSGLASLGLKQYCLLKIPHLESFGIIWNYLESFEILWNLLDSLDSFRFYFIVLDTFGYFLIILDFFGIRWIIFEYFVLLWNFLDSLVSAGCLWRLSLQAVSPSSFCRWILWVLWNLLEQLGRPGTVAPQSYLAVLWVSWAPRVSRVSRALLNIVEHCWALLSIFEDCWDAWLRCSEQFGHSESNILLDGLGLESLESCLPSAFEIDQGLEKFQNWQW